MKHIKFKFLLPVAAFMIAIAAAFATEKDGQDDFALEQGYIFVDGVCQPYGKCDGTQGQICTHNGFQVFGKIGGTSCLKTLYMNWRP